MFFDMGPLELLAIIIIAVMVFGPDKLPKLIQDVTGFIRKVRDFSDSAKEDIRKELGPEFQDFEFEDLKPKNFVRKHLLDGSNGDEYGLGELKSLKDDLGLDEIKESLTLDKKDFDLRAAVEESDAPDEIPAAREPAGAKVSFSKDESAPAPAGALQPGERPPFDVDAT